MKKKNIDKMIKAFLVLDIDELKYMKLNFENNEKDAENLFKQIQVILVICIFLSNLILMGKITEPTINILVIIVSEFVFLTVVIRIASNIHRKSQVELNVIKYCIDLKEKYPNLTDLDLINKFIEVSRKKEIAIISRPQPNDED